MVIDAQKNIARLGYLKTIKFSHTTFSHHVARASLSSDQMAKSLVRIVYGKSLQCLSILLSYQYVYQYKSILLGVF